MKTFSRPGQRYSRPQAMGGFTLIELIVVITILGVLAAVALPRFTSLQSDARKAKADAIFGSMRAASGIVKSTALVKAVDCTAASVTSTVTPAVGVVLEGRPINLVYCYPEATAVSTTGILGASNIDPTADGVTAAVATGVLTVTIAGGSATCNIAYTPPAAANTAPTIVNNATADGC